ncbi:putative Xaa-Pro aminopeptidase [Setomelanomma holmii]|uniref:Xaa-Pro aminopeptidase n=1 Tax=Setomelanomma holmii TaxID=210430 RepID=A0A9P4LFC8_9PLEO|nr:putative Xaa-Pro aminopeptidase [Setomelanomma holmii]
MEALDAIGLAERLKWEQKEYWLHLDSETPLEKYPAKQHARRVQEKLGVEQGLIYLAGQEPKNNEDSDMPAPFRQRRYFYYLSGCNEPGCHLTYDIQHDTLALFIPRIDEKRVIWNGRGSTLAEAMVKYDIDEVYYTDELTGFIAQWFLRERNDGYLYYLHSARSSAHLPNQSGAIIVDTTSLMPAMNLARMIKDDHEIKLIRKANDISSQAHREVLANITRFKNEAQVEGLFLDVCVSQQAKEQAYDPIAASGPNAGTLHYDANNEDFDDRQVMCLDAGCEYELYASDITRTFPLSSSWPSKEARNIYKLVERMQELCIERLAPGVRYLDLHILAHQIAIDGLLALGILHNGTREEIYKAGTSRAFFPHGLGHHVGLEVHDVGQAELMSVRRGKQVFMQAPSLYPESFHLPVYDAQTCLAPTDPQSSHLEEGMVVTIEPGIYFSVYALQHFYLPSPIHSKYINIELVQRYLPVGGVRIEDDLLITSKGYQNLTTAPKGDAMLEIIRSGKSAIQPSPSRIRSSLLRTNEETPLLRAPGITAEKPELMLRPIARAATLPAEFQERSPDFEPFEGPSLFSNFRRSMTTNERIRHWREANESEASPPRASSTNVQLQSLCGATTSAFKHTYMADTAVSFSNSTGRKVSEDITASFGPKIYPVAQPNDFTANYGSARRSHTRGSENPKEDAGSKDR